MALFGKKSRADCAVVIAAAGISRRMEGTDKIFAPLLGVPVLARTLRVFEDCDRVREIVIAASEGDIPQARELVTKYGFKKVTRIVAGGDTRLESVRNGVYAVSRASKLIAVHDGARPLVTGDIVRSAVYEARRHVAAAPAVAVKSTIKEAKNGVVTRTLDRQTLFEIQTPQVFSADILKAALDSAVQKGLAVTDDCAAVEALGVTVWLTDGSYENIKLTTPEDLYIAEAILTKRGESS
jgi:2-C-methyl-D-erythritol 4-phosphate cytidylyltransferase